MPIRILTTKSTPSHEERLRNLLEEAGCPVEEVAQEDIDFASMQELLADDAMEDEPEFAGLDSEEAEPDQAKDEVLIVEITPGCAEDEDAIREIRRCATGGGSVVGVWPPEGEKRGTIPEVLERLGGGLVEWSADRLRDAIVRGDLAWSNADGTARKKRNIERNRC